MVSVQAYSPAITISKENRYPSCTGYYYRMIGSALPHNHLNKNTDFSSSPVMAFSGKKGKRSRATIASACGDTEFFMTVTAPREMDLTSGLAILLSDYDTCLTECGLDSTTEIYLRFFLSDVTNDASRVQNALNLRQISSQVLIVGQPPANGAKIALEAYHFRGTPPIQKRLLPDNILHLTFKHYQGFYWRTPHVSPGNSSAQTREIVTQLQGALQKIQGTIQDNLFRTWIYVRDIDNNYAGMVRERKQYFAEIGLTEHTHFIASTGIEGCNQRPDQIVHMHALGFLGCETEQISYLTAPENMCPTSNYGVTFERGTRIVFGDRCHYHISGTASIDNNGQVLHRNNVVRQTERALKNMEALLIPHGASLQEMQSLIVYLRDPGDLEHIKPVLRNTFGKNLPPCSFVRGAVCRPEWLVEAEGFVCSSRGDNRFKPLA